MSIPQAYNPLIHDLSLPIADALGLKNLGPHFDTFVYSFVLFTLSSTVFVPGFSRLFFNRIYGALDAKARNKWHCRAVSLINIAIVVPLAIRCLGSPALSADRAFGWDERAGTAFAVTIGYFLWDSIDTVIHFETSGFVFHGVACFFVFLLCFRPFLAYYTIRCLLWEGSSIFLNLHWYMNKFGFVGTRLQTINGVILLTSFIGLRIVFGGYLSYTILKAIHQVRDEVPLAVALFYACGTILLHCLNWYWLFAILKGVKRMVSSPATHSKAE